MTTLIFDGKKLYADSKATNDNEAWISPMQKIFTPTEDDYWEVMGTKVVAFAISGDAADLWHIKDLLQAGITHRTLMDREHSMSEVIIVDEMGRTYSYVGAKKPNSTFNSLLLLDPPFAVGSGAKFANAILALGKGGELAMKIAGKLDIYTGGDIQVFELPPPPAVKSVRPQPAPQPEAQPAPAQ